MISGYPLKTPAGEKWALGFECGHCRDGIGSQMRWGNRALACEGADQGKPALAGMRGICRQIRQMRHFKWQDRYTPRACAEDMTGLEAKSSAVIAILCKDSSVPHPADQGKTAILMNLKLFYPWLGFISSHFPSFTVWQHKRLALASLGILLAEHCHLAKIARMLSRKDYATIERRLHRLLADDKWTAAQFSRDWIGWVANCLPMNRLVLLVDETSLSDRFRIMMIGAAYKRRCIPLIWRCYSANSTADYREGGQVKMITAMLKQIKAALPDDRPVLLMADRGIGNSPALCRAVQALGWHYLFRIPKTVKVITAKGALLPCEEIKKGGRWGASGIVFITKGQILRKYGAIALQGCVTPFMRNRVMVQSRSASQKAPTPALGSVIELPKSDLSLPIRGWRWTNFA